MTAFIAFYSQFNAAGYYDGGGCPEVSYLASGGAAGASGVSFVNAPVISQSPRLTAADNAPEIIRETP